MTKNKPFQQDSESASTAPETLVDVKPKRKQAPPEMAVTLSPGMWAWLKDQARRKNHDLGARVVTPAMIAHELLRISYDVSQGAEFASIKHRFSGGGAK